RHGGFGVIHHELERGRRVLDVVEPKRTTLHMLGAADPAGVGAETVESRLLVLILSVLQGLSEKSRDRDLGWKAVAILASHVCGDPGVVGRRMRVRLGGQASPRGLIERALVEHAKKDRKSVV